MAKSVPGHRNSKCTGPEVVGSSLVCSRNLKEARVAGAERVSEVGGGER